MSILVHEDGSCSVASPPPPPASFARKIVAEFVGTGFLVAAIIGSGMMGDNLSPDDGVALLGNTLATWGILYVLISTLGPVSGAHFNPMVTTCFFLKRDLDGITLLVYSVAQIAGGIAGAFVAHGMFMHRNTRAGRDFDGGKDRDSDGEMFSEMVSSIGLLLTIFGGIAANKDVGMLVGMFIVAGYWFTSSTSFANPAVTIARSFTDTFAGISPHSIPKYFAGQALGMVIGLPFCEWMFSRKTPAQALGVMLRRDDSKAGAAFQAADIELDPIAPKEASEPTTCTSCP